MTRTGDDRAPYESGETGQKSHRRPFRPEINEETQNVSQDACQNISSGGGNSASTFAAIGISELQQMLKHKIFSRPTGGSPDDFHEKANKGSTISTSQPPTQDSKLIINKNATSMENLPCELLANIFIRLLAKQLAQMRCVSKSWNALLSQSSFVKSHLHRSITNNDQTFLVFYYKHNNSKPFTVVSPSRSPHFELTNLIQPPTVNPESGNTTWMRVIGSVHGLICSRYGDDVVQIWNPSLSAVSTLPPYSLPSCCYEIFFRFGFDPKTEDYKVVKLIGLIGPPSESEDGVPRFQYVIKKWLQAEVYSMRKGSWDSVTQRFPSHITRIFDKDEVCIAGHDGRVHWVGHTTEKFDSEMIVAFNLSSETFLEMSLPDSTLDFDRLNTLGVLGGKLCVMSQVGDDGIEVWVMDEYGVAESWVKRHVFCFSHYFDEVVTGFTSHGEFVIEDKNCHLVLYDPTADKAKILLNHDLKKGVVYKIVEYVDNLVWVPRAAVES